MINWRNISKVGFPKNPHIKYLVTDGNDISSTTIYGTTHFKDGSDPAFTFKGWVGDDNTSEENSCCSGTKVFYMYPTHWCPVDELNLPEE